MNNDGNSEIIQLIDNEMKLILQHCIAVLFKFHSNILRLKIQKLKITPFRFHSIAKNGRQSCCSAFPTEKNTMLMTVKMDTCKFFLGIIQIGMFNARNEHSSQSNS